MKATKLFSIVCLTTALSFAGCKKDGAGGKPESAAVASDDDYLKQAGAMLDRMTGAVKAAGTDCDKLADSVTKLASDNAPLMASLQAYEKAHPDAKQKFDGATKDKTKAFEEAAVPAMTACAGNEKVGKAFEKLGG